MCFTCAQLPPPPPLVFPVYLVSVPPRSSSLVRLFSHRRVPEYLLRFIYVLKPEFWVLDYLNFFHIFRSANREIFYLFKHQLSEA